MCFVLIMRDMVIKLVVFIMCITFRMISVFIMHVIFTSM